MRNLNDCAPKLLKFDSKNFYHYLTGLIEADGSFIIPTSDRTPKGKLLYPSIQISFKLSDFPLAQAIQKELGSGSLNRKKQQAAYTLTINSKKGLNELITQLNGKLRGPKVHRFYDLIDYLCSKDSSFKLEKLPIDNSPLTDNGWLSGFSDGDSSFQLRCSLKAKTPRVAMS